MEEVKKNIIRCYSEDKDDDVIKLYQANKEKLRFDFNNQVDRMAQQSVLGSSFLTGAYRESLFLANQLKRHYKSKKNKDFSKEEISQLFLDLMGIHTKLGNYNNVHAISFTYKLQGGDNIKILEYYNLLEKKIQTKIGKAINHFVYVIPIVILLRYALLYLFMVDLTLNIAYNALLLFLMLCLLAKQKVIDFIKKAVNYFLYLFYW